jgi:hypothetical protein
MQLCEKNGKINRFPDVNSYAAKRHVYTQKILLQSTNVVFSWPNSEHCISKGVSLTGWVTVKGEMLLTCHEKYHIFSYVMLVDIKITCFHSCVLYSCVYMELCLFVDMVIFYFKNCSSAVIKF